MAHGSAAAIAQALGHNSGRGLCHVHPQTAPLVEVRRFGGFRLLEGWLAPSQRDAAGTCCG